VNDVTHPWNGAASAQPVDCVRLAGAVAWLERLENGSKLRALLTLLDTAAIADA
jgi:hypothetical protein